MLKEKEQAILCDSPILHTLYIAWIENTVNGTLMQ